MRYMAFALGGDEDWSALSPEGVEQAVQRYTEWAEKVAAAGQLVAGGSLDDDARTVPRSEHGAADVAGGSGSARSRIRGWTEVEAVSLDAAAALFADHPHLAFGTVEIRPVTDLG